MSVSDKISEIVLFDTRVSKQAASDAVRCDTAHGFELNCCRTACFFLLFFLLLALKNARTPCYGQGTVYSFIYGYLFDTSSIHYNNLKKVVAGWREIATKLEVSGKAFNLCFSLLGYSVELAS